MTALSVRGLTKSYGSTPVLRGVDLQVDDGTFTAVLGPSGCGKTTLLRLIAGFLDPDSGSIALGDTVVAGPGVRLAAERRRVGYVPQEGALFPHLTAGANIAFGLVRARRHRDRVAELLALVGLNAEIAGRFPHQLSGGQQQRVALARALAPGPEVVLLDEPFSSLDAALRDGTRRAVASALREAKATAVLVTHDQDEALSLADQVAVMRRGVLVQADSPIAVYERPADADVATFVGEAVLLPAVVSGGVADCALGPVPVSPGPSGARVADGAVQVLIRPESIVLLDASADGALAEVLDVRYYGHDAAIGMRLVGSGLPVLARTMGRVLPEVGSAVRLRVDGPVMTLPAAPIAGGAAHLR